MFSALAVQITIPKYKEIPGQFYLLLQWAKHINKTYMYFNLLLIISAADKKNNNNKKIKNFSRYVFMFILLR